MVTSVFVGTVALGGTAAAAPSDTSIGFGKDTLSGFSPGNPTSLDFGPDGRLYVATQSGSLYGLTVQRNGPNDYEMADQEPINTITSIPNHDDDGSYDAGVTNRQVTGLTAAGTAANPVLYVTSSDPRIGGGGSGDDTNLDTNSGTISKLTLTDDGSWDHVMLVRGLPRSEENHATNGLQLATSDNTLYVAQGGHTNKGAPSNNFAYTPEYALSGAILSIDLDEIEALSAKDAANTDVPYLYDIPTLAGTATPFGGDNGKNMAKLVENGPVKVFSPGYRNPYDVTLTDDGQLYTVDNGPNGGWGGPPTGDGTATCTNEPNEDQSDSTGDNLHLVAEDSYGGHANPTRGNPNGAGLYDSEGNEIGSVAGAVYDGYDHPNQCDYHDPTQDNSLDYGGFEAFGRSTNGLDEYTASNFGGAMQGDLLTSSFDGNIYRVQLNSAGDDLTATPTALLSSGGTLDVVAQGDDGEFPGTVWSANRGTNSIAVFEPNDYGDTGGENSCDVSDPNGDADGDGYTNADEQAASTDPCSAGSVPDDNDNDDVSDVTDTDDDNDGLADTVDPFPVDGDNGLSTTLPVNYDFSQDSQPDSLEGIGFTGLLTNGEDYQDLYVPGDAVFGGANPALTQEVVKSGDAVNKQNTQQHAYQFGIDAPSEPFVVHAPVTGYPENPEDFQAAGIQLGTGDQDNYLKLVVAANSGTGGVEFATEVGGSFTTVAQPDDSSVTGPGTLTDLYMTVYPSNDTVVASYAVDGGARKTVDKTTIPAEWLSNQVNGQETGLAVGVIATSFQSSEFSVTWNDFNVTPLNAGGGENQPPVAAAGADQTVEEDTQVRLDGSASSDPDDDTLGYSWVQTGGPAVQLDTKDAPTLSFTAPNASEDTTLSFELTVSDGQVSDTDTVNVAVRNGDDTDGRTSADVTVNEGSEDIDASTYDTGAFSITNTGDTAIDSATIDLSQSTLPDAVFDPDGTAGDSLAKEFTVNNGVGGETTGTFAGPHNGQNGEDGYDALNIAFTDFQPGETLTFSVDIDPTSIQGASGSGGAGSVSGLELSGSAVTVESGDTIVENDLFTDGSNGGSQAGVTASSAAAPTLGVESVVLGGTDFPAHGAATVGDQQQTIEVSGQAGETVELLHVVGSPVQADGYDVDAYEADSATAVNTQTVQLDSNGEGSVDVTLADSGIDYFLAAIEDSVTGRTSETMILDYDQSATDTNDSPSASFTVSDSPMAGEGVTFDASASSDGDGSITSYEWDFGDDTTATGENVSHTYDSADDYDVTLTITDDDDATDTTTQSVTVGASNQPPTAEAGGAQTVEEGSTVALDGSGSSDPDGIVEGYAWSGPASVSVNDADTAMPSFTAPAVDEPTTLTFDLEVADDDGATDTDTVDVTVAPVDEAPPTIGDFDVSATDQNVDVSFDSNEVLADITVTLGSDASGTLDGSDFSRSENGGVFTYTADVSDGQDGTFDATLDTAADAAGNDGANGQSDSVTVSTVPLNRPPTADAGDDQTVLEGSSVSLDASGSTDPDDDALAYSWTQTGGSDVTLSDAAAKQPTFTAPEVDSDTTLTFELTITDDDGATDTDSVNIVVQPANEQPTAIISGPKTGHVGEELTFDASASSDPDGSIERYEWDFDGDATTDAIGQSVSTTFDSAGTYEIEVAVTDAQAATATATRTISVTEAPDPADLVVSKLNAAASATRGDTVPVTATIENTGDRTATQTVELSVDTGVVADQQVTLNGGASKQVSFSIHTSDLTPGTHIYGVSTDDDSANAELTIETSNAPPTADAGAAQTVEEDSSVSLDGSGSSDPDGSVEVYAWSGPASVSVNDADTATPSFTAPAVDEPMTLAFELTITDDDGATDTDSVNIVVQPANEQPLASFEIDPDSPETGQSVRFDASSASDPDGSIQTYHWTFDDASTTTGETVSHTFGSAGDYTVELLVTDDDGATDTATQTVSVGPAPVVVEPPQDLDGDGLYEDINGDGVFDVVDVQALFVYRNGVAARPDAMAFNFNGDTDGEGPQKGEPKIDVVDVQRLFRMLID